MSEDEDQPKRRVSLTKKQLAEEQGAKLLSILCEITNDGKLSGDEVRQLGDWLLENRALDYPAVGVLLEVLARVLADGVVSDDEKLELHLAIERVIPITERKHTRQKREEQEEIERLRQRDERREKSILTEDLKSGYVELEASLAREEAPWRSDPATDAQRKFIRSLGGTLHSGATKGEASDIIEGKLGNQPLSNRQMMILRFWNRSRQQGEDRRAVSDWLDSFYTEDQDRKRAWELYKEESEDDGLQGNPERVPLGIGPNYLERVKKGGSDAIPRFRPQNAPRRSSNPQTSTAQGATAGTWVVILVILVVAIVKLISAYSQ